MSELSAVVRFLNLTASVLLAGGFGFALLIVRPAYLAVPTHGKADLASFVRVQLRVASWCLIAIFACAVLGLWFQVLYVSDSAVDAQRWLDAAFSLLMETQFGRVWLLRMALLVLLTGFIVRTLRPRSDHDLNFFVTGCALSALLLSVSALAGHASAAEGWTLAFQVSSDVLHLLACGLWVGGLCPLFAVLAACRRKGDAAACAFATSVTQNFSRLAIASVAALIATGGFNAWNLVGGFAPLFGTVYGNLLLVKIALLLPMLGLGAMNLFRLKPKIVQTAGTRPKDNIALLEQLRWNVAVEMVFGLGILLIVSHMGLLAPARHIQANWPFPFRWDWSVLDKAPAVRQQVIHGIYWFAGGFAAFLYATVRKRMRIPVAMVGLSLWIYASTVILVAVSIDAYPTTFKRPAIAYEAFSVAAGKRLYADNGCPVCHGPSGYGDGPSANQLRPKPADLTAPHANSHTAGDLFWWISYGMPKSAMPGFGEKLSEEDRWDLINFLRALSDSERVRGLGPRIEGEPWLIAPDFTFGTTGDTAMLRDYRGNRIVLLVLTGPRDTEERLMQLKTALPRLRSASVQVIAVPNAINYPANTYPEIIASEGLREISETYTLFARSILDEELLAAPPHTEFLIDRQGYIRARWLPSEGDAWSDIGNLLMQVELLRQEKPRAPAPDWHVH
jgi:putative copper export protein/mono/diheme cytochrome c family protein